MKKVVLLIVALILLSGIVIGYDGGATECLTTGTQILTPGGKKPVEDIEVGDRVIGQNGINTVKSLYQKKLGEQPVYSINNGRAFVTKPHPFMTSEGWKAIDPVSAKYYNPYLDIKKLKEEDTIITKTGTVKVNSITPHQFPAQTPIYNFAVTGDKTYYADSWLVHNKGDNLLDNTIDYTDGDTDDDTDQNIQTYDYSNGQPNSNAPPNIQSCLNAGVNCKTTTTNGQTVQLQGHYVIVKGDVKTSGGKMDADYLVYNGVEYENVKNFHVYDGKVHFDSAKSLKGNMPVPSGAQSIQTENLVAEKDKMITGDYTDEKQAVEIIKHVEYYPNVKGDEVAGYLQANYPGVLEDESVQNQMQDSYPETDLTKYTQTNEDGPAVASPPPIGVMQAEDVSVKDMEYVSGELKQVTLTSTTDNNEIIMNGVRAVLDAGENITFVRNENGKFEISASPDSVVEDGYLATSAIEISPGSRYNFVGGGFKNFAVYIPSGASEYTLYLKTTSSESYSLSCTQCGLIDFVNHNATMKGQYEFEKPSTLLPVFTNIIEANGPFKFSLDSDAANITELFPASFRVYSGDFVVGFSGKQGYSFNEGNKPYAIENVMPNINVTEKSLAREKSLNYFKMYSEDADGFWQKWNEVLYE